MNMQQVIHWMTRQINRRRFLSRSTAVVFGTLAGLTVGVQEAYAIPCGPSADCRSISSQFCSGHRCVCDNAFCCSPEYRGCSGPAGDCWSPTAGHYCCDCICNVFSGGGHTFHCICYS